MMKKIKFRLVLIALLISLLLAGACAFETTPPGPVTLTETLPVTTPAVKSITEPQLSDRLVSDGKSNPNGLKPGDLAVNFTLKDVQGKETTLSKLLGEKPVVMVFGSFT